MSVSMAADRQQNYGGEHILLAIKQYAIYNSIIVKLGVSKYYVFDLSYISKSNIYILLFTYFIVLIG